MPTCARKPTRAVGEMLVDLNWARLPAETRYPSGSTRSITCWKPAPKLDFIHSVDEKREAGYAWLEPNYHEGASHAQPATSDYTGPPQVRVAV